MIKQLAYITVVALTLSACGAKKDNKARLEDLRSQEAKIKSEIALLEAEIAKEGGAQSVQKAKYVGITILKPQIFHTYIDVQGRVDTDENIAVSSQMPGTVTRIFVKVGEHVSKGDILAETDARAIQQGIAELQTNMDLTNTLYEKQKNLWDQKIGTEVQFLQARTQKESLEKRLASLQEQLKMTRIVSPIDGTVDEVNVKLGSAVAPGVPAIRVVNLDNLKVKADLAEAYATKVKAGDKVFVFLPDSQDSLEAQIDYSAKTISALNRTFGVEVQLNNAKDYRPNMVAKLKINNYSSSKPVLVVPVGTIQTDELGNKFVLTNKNNKATKQLVVKGKEYNGYAEILSGLLENDQLISLGYEAVNDGDALVTK